METFTEASEDVRYHRTRYRLTLAGAVIGIFPGWPLSSLRGLQWEQSVVRPGSASQKDRFTWHDGHDPFHTLCILGSVTTAAQYSALCMHVMRVWNLATHRPGDDCPLQ